MGFDDFATIMAMYPTRSSLRSVATSTPETEPTATADASSHAGMATAVTSGPDEDMSSGITFFSLRCWVRNDANYEYSRSWVWWRTNRRVWRACVGWRARRPSHFAVRFSRLHPRLASWARIVEIMGFTQGGKVMYTCFRGFEESCPSGRRSTIGNRVYA